MTQSEQCVDYCRAFMKFGTGKNKINCEVLLSLKLATRRRKNAEKGCMFRQKYSSYTFPPFARRTRVVTWVSESVNAAVDHIFTDSTLYLAFPRLVPKL